MNNFFFENSKDLKLRGKNGLFRGKKHSKIE